ncbi:pentatricopeptide repeat-containing protein At3g12770-like [Malania oleifera]|uniref:pentatricopeptide repeat-containing protein At3g12770-like n=1 Tax=Malania oleifera TaxID=397392 RepID=UPI0025AE944B|nr:pentatricopeptide repeat-containing protein At3g12770-like [Malania oleifera]
MSSQCHLHHSQKFDFITAFLHQSLQTKNLRVIKKLHSHLLRTGLLFVSLSIHAKLIFSYTSCLHRNTLQTLTSFFTCINPTNPLPFNVIISHFCQHGSPFLALHTFSFMHITGVPLDTYALCSSLTASSTVKNVTVGKQLHAHVAKLGWTSSVFVGSALVDLYAKALLIGDASHMFDEIPVKNTVCANALLSGFVEAKLWVEGLELVQRMPVLSLKPDHFTLSAALRVCAGLSAVELGKQVHANLIRTIFDMDTDVFLQTSLIEMYGKCGLVEKALQAFNSKGVGLRRNRQRDVVLWTSMLGVYGRSGQFNEVIGLYKMMLMEGIRPDGVAYVTVLSACGHSGHLGHGFKYFESMARDYGLDPGPEHYSCLVDLLCRAGELDKAWKLVNEMPYQRNSSCNVSMWGALLNGCIESGNVDLGKLAAQRALELDPQNVGIYILLSNLYARLRMWDEIGQLRELVKERGLKKDVACSWIEFTC